MNTRFTPLGLALVPVLIGVTVTITAPAWAPPPRPQGPCDIHGAAGTPCVAAFQSCLSNLPTTTSTPMGSCHIRADAS